VVVVAAMNAYSRVLYDCSDIFKLNSAVFSAL